MKFYLAIFLKTSTIELLKKKLPPSLRQITRFALELERFVRDRATSIENEKLRSEGVAMYAYSVSVHYA